VRLDPIKCTFWGILYLGPQGCCALQFLHALKIDQGYLVHTPTGTGVPAKKFNRENLKFCLKFSVCASITSGLVGVSSLDCFQSTSREAWVITWVQFLQCPPPKICERKKSSKIFRNFWLLSTFIANISGTDLHIEHLEKKLDQPQPLPRWRKETWWTLVHKQKGFRGAYWATQVDIFRETIFRPIGGAADCCPLKFLYTLEIGQGYLAHTPTGTSLPKKFYREN